MYEAQTKAVIQQEMLDSIDPTLDKREGSITYDLTAPAAIEVSQAYVELDNVLKFGFASTSYGEYLEKRANEVGITKLPNETDAQLYLRFQERVSRPAASGNKAQYVAWAKEVVGVGRAKCFAVWNGPGTVKVVVTDTLFKVPTTALVNTVQAYIDPTPGQGEGKAPIGATVTVAAGANRTIDVSFTGIPVAGKTTNDIQAEFLPLLDQYLTDTTFTDTVIRWSKIGQIVLDCPSALDYSNLLVNTGTGNVQLSDSDIPVRGTVTIS